jgi:nitrite reductase/ring-hydroxylating ferredoxin subunit
MKIELCRTNDVEEGAMLQVALEDRPPVTVYRVEDRFYVTDDTCTHGKASFAEDGELEGFSVVCTWHDGKFDIRTGAPLCAPCSVPIKTYPVSIEEGAVLIEVN